MIGRIKGIILEKIPPHILIDCNGVGYEIEVPMTTFYDLPEVGSEVTLLTHFLVREDAQLLFGFATDQERIIFRKLLKVNGIGAKASLSILGGMTVQELTHTIQAQDVTSLTKIPGVGKKTAERLILELKDKFSDSEFKLTSNANSTEMSDIQNALSALGYNQKDIVIVTKDLDKNISVNEGIKKALKLLSN
ncbi:MAG: Holliday junction branch migration protein RuvA [Nitrosomonadales bacterium]|jgi:Holliday junction DNA helicase RuvA|nr:Holliday junction branch migration protein RuvA [Nitrosomonadales bacterium]MBT6356151.1 Holliday junction branch migration protein RuvA [Nitrosomonadales bacterium]MCH9771390.1 Holliday junction branch migration protein RuvA [Betaproteobacteria bacterium]